MVAPPQEEEGDEIANGWAKSFIQYMNRIRARQRAEKCAALKTPETQREAILRKLNDFAADFGAEECEILREQMDRFFGPRTSEAKLERHAASAVVQPEVEVQPEVAAQSHPETESKAETELASAEGEALRRESQSKLRIENAPAAQVSGQLAVGDGRKRATSLSPSSSSPAQSMLAPQKGRTEVGESFFQSKLGTDSASLRQAILEVLGIRTRRDKRSVRQNNET